MSDPDMPNAHHAETKAKFSDAKRALLEQRLRGRAAAPSATLIPRRPAGPTPLSFAQQRLWFLNRLDTDSAAYHVPAALRLRGRLEIPALERAINEIVRRHEILRTVFADHGGQPVQIVLPELRLNLPIHDLGGLPETERDADILRRAREDGARPFDLAAGPLVRVSLLRLGEQDHVLLFNLHHIVSDGWSSGLLFGEFAQLYRAFLENQASPLPELPIQYGDFAYWQRDWLQGERLEQQAAYWRRELDGAPPRLDLPADHPRPEVQSGRGALHGFRLPKTLADRLRDLGRERNATLFMTLIAGFCVLLHRYSGRDDLCLGASVANRTRPEFESLLGLFANMLVYRADLSGNPAFTAFLDRMRTVAVGAQSHQDLPFERLVEELNPPRDRDYSPFLQVVFVLHNLPSQGVALPELTVQPLDIDFGTAKSDLTLHVTEDGDGLELAFEYSTDLFAANRIARMAGHLRALLDGIAARPDTRLSELPLLTAAEWAALTEQLKAEAWQPEDGCLHGGFEAQARTYPQRPALICGDESLSYGELDRRADRLANRLRALGVGPEARVGLCLARSVAAIVGILGILKAGGAYVPLDPAAPPERLAELLADCGAALLLTQAGLAAALPPGTPALCPDAAGEWPGESAGAGHHCADPRPESAAYLIYTSGSTGQPKGVVVGHRNAVASTAARHAFYPEAPDGFLVVSPLAFDSSVAGIFWTLGQGGRLCLPPEGAHQNPKALAGLIHREHLSHLLCLPSLYGLLLDCAAPGQLDSLRAVIVAGETCPPALVAKHYRNLPHTRLYNEYGPTEATVWGSVHAVLPAEADGAAIPIGRPVAHMRAYVLDAQLNPLPAGIPGELYLGGAGVARGYHARPGLTAERFLPDPFAPGPARLYRTGDLARFRPDGVIEFLGRIDQQVKIRGFRIEPGEIEDRLLRHPAVREAVVMARTDPTGGQRLVAYVAATPEENPATLPEHLRLHLKENLPDYMVPAAFVVLAGLPVTANGKLDRNALPEPDLAGQFAHRYSAPHEGVETRLAQLWAELLGVERVGAHDNFFDLGGHSLAAVQLIVRLQGEFGGDWSVADLFEAPTVAEFAALIARQDTDALLEELARLPEEEARRLLEELEA